MDFHDHEPTPQNHMSLSHEVLASRPPVHFIFGAHAVQDVSGLSHDRAQLERTLIRKPQGRVYYFTENSQYSHTTSERITTLVNEGFLPSVANTMSLFYEEIGRFPSEAELPHALAEMRRTNGVFINGVYEFLDQLTFQYPGRVGVLVEGYRPGRNFIPGNSKDKLMEANIEASGKLLREGKFSQAAMFYSKANDSMATEIRERDEDIATDLRDRVEEEGVAEILVRIGAAHTGIMHTLQRSGYAIKQEFLGQDNHEPFLYDPDTVDLRKRRFLPKQLISRHEAVQALIGDEIFYSIVPKEEFRTSAAQRQRTVELTRTILAALQTENSIRIFEARVRKIGFAEATDELARQIGLV